MIENMISMIKNKIKSTNLLLAFNLVYKKSYLIEKGFVRSWALGYPVDKLEEKIPWWTYSFTEFLTPRLNKNFKIFEYGAGNSSIYLSQFVDHIVSIENDKNWFDYLSSRITDNVSLIYADNHEYVEQIESSDALYDIIIIDGIRRNECASKAIHYLTDDGVIIFDDSERFHYNTGYTFLINQGFKRIDFTGFAPCSLNLNSTSVFYKSNNILNL